MSPLTTRSNMTLTQDSSGPVCTVRVDGPLRVMDRSALAGAVNVAVDDGRRVVVLDLARAGHIDMGAMGMLATLCHRLRALGGDLRLVGLDPALTSVFDLTHLDAMFPVYASHDAARHVDIQAAP